MHLLYSSLGSHGMWQHFYRKTLQDYLCALSNYSVLKIVCNEPLSPLDKVLRNFEQVSLSCARKLLKMYFHVRCTRPHNQSFTHGLDFKLHAIYIAKHK